MAGLDGGATVLVHCLGRVTLVHARLWFPEPGV